MAESTADPLRNLVKRASNHLARKLSGLIMILVSHKHAGTLGAAVGFAVAFVFAWRFLNPPARPPRRKPRGNAASSSTGGSEIYRQLMSLRESEAAEGMRSPANLSLGQAVKKKLNGGRKITCQILGIILEESTSDELQKHATIRLSAVDVLHELTKFCDIYLMETVKDDESEERILAALESGKLFKAGGLVKEKVLFCSTDIGRSSFVRQLEPDWHIDTSSEIIFNLARFIRYQLHISPATPGISASNIFTSETLEQYFSHLTLH